MDKVCQHITESGRIECDHGVMGHVEKGCEIWKFCPICGAKRPEPKKALWEILKEISGKGLRCDESLDQYFKKLSDSALDAVIEVVEEVHSENLKTSKYWSDIKTKELIEKLEALRGGA